MLTETQQVILQTILIFIIVFCLTRLAWLLWFYISDRIQYNRYARNHFNKIEEYWNDIK